MLKKYENIFQILNKFKYSIINFQSNFSTTSISKKINY